MQFLLILKSIQLCRKSVSININSELEPLGAKLRARRHQLTLTLQEVANRSNLSVGFISQVERDIVMPSLTSLATMARILKMQISDVLVVPRGSSLATRSSERNIYPAGEGSIKYERISANFPSHVINAVIQHTQPGVNNEMSQHEGEELYYMLSGAVTVEIEGNKTVLNKGDSIHFSSQQSHNFLNHTSEPATMLVVCTMDVFGDAIR